MQAGAGRSWFSFGLKKPTACAKGAATTGEQERYPGIDTVVDISADEVGSAEPKRQITLLVIGAGMRGNVYATYAKDFPERMKVVGVAEPIQQRREMFKRDFRVPDEHAFVDWKDAAKLERFADAVAITTLDDLHHAPLLAFAALGYHILCEKPMAMTESECQEMADAVRRSNVILCVGHVMRYAPNIVKMKQLIESGEIGHVIGIQHLEPIGWRHFAHSYVRGNWRKEVGDAGSLMAKSCHDIDIIKYLMGDKKCRKVQSFGSLSYFHKANKPKGASSRCLDCRVEKECAYSAVKSYLEPVQRGGPNGFCFVVCAVPDIESMTEALRSGPYGRCVYESDNDVCDNQVVNLEFDGGATASFTMCAFTEAMCKRRIRVFGSKGEISLEEGKADGFTSFNFVSRKKTMYRRKAPQALTTMAGHGFADYYLMNAFVQAVAAEDPSIINSSAEDSLRGHKIVFAAERSRKNGGRMLEVDI